MTKHIEPDQFAVLPKLNEVLPKVKTDKMEMIQRVVAHCKQYQGADHKRSIHQILNTFIPFTLLVGFMIWTATFSVILPLLLSFLSGAFLIRIFIIQHDCGHGSFFGSERLNNRVGQIMSLFTVTPYAYWRRAHALHHASSGNLDRRGVGDITTLTVREYRDRGKWGRIRYRIFRNPLFLLGFGIPILFTILQRSPWGQGFPARQVWKSIIGLNAAIFLFYGTFIWLFGLATFLLTVIPTIVVAAWIGGWLFYIQHQFEDTYWEKKENWNWHEAAILGSSYYDLPNILRWFTGNIGFHHIHHVSSRIPNYKLKACFENSPDLKGLNRITLWQSFKYMNYSLWDEENAKLIRFRDLKALPAS